MSEQEPPKPRKRAPAKKAAAKKAPAKKAAPRKRAPAKKATPPPPPPAEEVHVITNLPARVEDAPPPDAADQPVEDVAGDVFDPAYNAWMARLRGKSWHQAALENGYRDADSCRKAVEVYRMRAVAESAPARRAEALELSVSRYDAVIDAFWDAAVVGHDANAAMVVLRAQQARDKTLRVGEPDQDTSGRRTVVVAGSREEYVRKLQGVVARAAGRPDADPELVPPTPQNG